MTQTTENPHDGIVLTAELAQRKLEDYDAFDWDQVVAIDLDAAEIIARFSGGLVFPRIRQLTNEVAIALSAHDAITLDAMTTLDGLSEEALGALGASEGYRCLDGVASITPSQLRLLTQGNGHLSLGGLTTLTNEHLAILALHTGSLSLNGLLHLTAESVRQLLRTSAEVRDSISLNGLTEIDEQTAAVFGLTREMDIRLDGLTHISPRVAAHLARAGGRLSLGGLRSLSEDVARTLATHAGALWLDGMPTITEATAFALSHHRGELLLFNNAEKHEKRCIANSALRCLSSHHGSIGTGAIAAPSLTILAETLARRSTISDRTDASSDDDFIWLGEDGEFSDHNISTGAIEAKNTIFALAHHLQTGAVTTLTPRELLGWFGAQRRGKKVVDRVVATIEAFRQQGFDALGAISTLLEADDLDLVHVFPPTAPASGSFADALRAPMTRLGYHIVEGNDETVRFQSAFATGRRRMLLIERVEATPTILRAEVSVNLPDDAATMALAITTANRMNRLSFVGRFRVDLVARTLRYDVVGAVRILSDLRTADGDDGVLPRLLSYVEAADLMMHRLLLDEPVHDPPERAIEGADLSEAASELDGIMVQGTSLRVAQTIDLGQRPFDPDEGDEEPPRVDPALVGVVTRANAERPCAKAYLVRDTQEMESVIIEMAVIATDAAIVSPVAEWLTSQAKRAETEIRTHLTSSGITLQERIATVDEILASLNDSASEADFAEAVRFGPSLPDGITEALKAGNALLRRLQIEQGRRGGDAVAEVPNRVLTAEASEAICARIRRDNVVPVWVPPEVLEHFEPFHKWNKVCWFIPWAVLSNGMNGPVCVELQGLSVPDESGCFQLGINLDAVAEIPEPEMHAFTPIPFAFAEDDPRWREWTFTMREGEGTVSFFEYQPDSSIGFHIDIAAAILEVQWPVVERERDSPIVVHLPEDPQWRPFERLEDVVAWGFEGAD